MAANKRHKTASDRQKDADVKNARADVKLARADALRAKAEAAAAKAANFGGGPVSGFLNFIREKGVVGLAIGLAIGTAATGLVSQIVNAVITPTVSLLLGLVGLENLKSLNFVAKRAADGSALITYAVGDLIDALIKFLAIAAVIYFVVIGLKLDRLDKKKDA